MGDRVLLYGGPYSNLQAFEALVDWAKRNGFTAGRRICTGDIVAYCAQGPECIDLFLREGGHTIKGNCEGQLGVKASDCGCGFDEGTACDVIAKGWYAYADSTIGIAQRSWMKALPDWLVFHLKGRRYVVVHGSAGNASRFLWPVSANIEFRRGLEEIKEQIGPVDGVIAGHSGIAFEREIDGVQWINAGAIGMPANDGNPQTQFATLGPDGLRFHRLEYNVAGAVQAMEKAGLNQGYEQCLKTGYWPSEDVLPEALRRDFK